MTTVPSIENSTTEERRAFVAEQWRCLHNCELCGKCNILKGRNAELLYADYIEGRRTYREITLEIRNRNY
ncbi:MAG: hypothetical protein IKU22_07740 [Alistipes sp.]|nr:hypothetical protein [Alistipes sp.]